MEPASGKLFCRDKQAFGGITNTKILLHVHRRSLPVGIGLFIIKFSSVTTIVAFYIYVF